MLPSRGVTPSDAEEHEPDPAPLVAWVRARLNMAEPLAVTHDRVRPVIVIRSTEAVGRLRIGLWDGYVRLAGFELPFVPAEATVTIDSIARRVFMDLGSGREPVNSYARGWDGALRWQSIRHAVYTLTVDQEQGRHVPVRVEAFGAQTRAR